MAVVSKYLNVLYLSSLWCWRWYVLRWNEVNDVGIVGLGDCWPDRKEDRLSASGDPGSLSHDSVGVWMPEADDVDGCGSHAGQRGSTRFHHATQNGVRFKPSEFFFSRIFHLIFSEGSSLQAAERVESKTMDKGELLNLPKGPNWPGGRELVLIWESKKWRWGGGCKAGKVGMLALSVQWEGVASSGLRLGLGLTSCGGCMVCALAHGVLDFLEAALLSTWRGSTQWLTPTSCDPWDSS